MGRCDVDGMHDELLRTTELMDQLLEGDEYEVRIVGGVERKVSKRLYPYTFRSVISYDNLMMKHVGARIGNEI